MLDQEKTTFKPFLLLGAMAFANTGLASANIHQSHLRAAAPAFTPQPVSWHKCTTDGDDDSGLDCANVTVPLDWSQPDGQTITLSMNRAHARDPNARIGYAIYNPGGPGGSAIEDVADYASGDDFIEPEILNHFDLVGLDPRGVGASSPIKCDPDIWNDRVSLYPKTQEEFQKLVQHNKDFAASCIEKSGDLVGHVDTTSVAKDMEAVRVALGDEKLNYIGISYGTTIAAAYAELYPQNIRAMVMDGVTDHSESELLAQMTEYLDTEREFVRFAEWCSAEKKCKLYGKDILKLFDDLLEKAEKSPIPAPGCTDDCRHNVTWEEIPMNMQDALVTKLPGPGDTDTSGTWFELAENLAKAFDGDATEFSSPVAQGEDFEGWQGILVNCLDYPHNSRDVSDLRYQNQLAFTAAPHTRGVGESYVPSASCLGWPYPVQNPPHTSQVEGAPPILLVNSYYDPETPFSQAVSVQEQLPSGVLLIRDGDGHSSFDLGGEASQAMATYLVNLTLPEPNTVVKT